MDFFLVKINVPAMFILIKNDILKSAIESPRNSRSAHVLMELSIAVSRGKHYVFIPQWDIYSKDLNSVLSKSTFNILNGLKRQDGNVLNRNINRKLIVTDSAQPEDDENAIVFSPSRNPSFEIFEETHLLCENINEKRFYDKVEAYYRRNHASDYVCETRYNILPRNGGGATSVSVLKTETQMKNHLVLIIADSDYKYRLRTVVNGEDVIDKGEKGCTAKSLVRQKAEHPYGFSDIYVMEECREVENLIPKEILEDLYPNNKDIAKWLLDNYDMEYLDVKEGLRIVHMFDDKVLQYWIDALTELPYDTQKITDIKRTHNGSKKSYKEHLKNCTDAERLENIIVDGWGYGILETSLNIKDNEYDSVSPDDLTTAQQQEWEKIGKILFEWGLASHPSFV